MRCSHLLAILSLFGCSSELDIGTSSETIVGGSDVSISSVPWQVALVDGGQFCGGSIVGARWVLTAAHCVERVRDFSIIAGTSDWSDGTGQVRHAISVTKFPGYVTPESGKDVALIELDSAYRFGTGNVGPIRLLSKREAAMAAPGTDAKISGWGSTRPRAGRSLQRASVEIKSLAAATRVYGSLTSDQLPAGGGSTDSCQGDSGGPLTVLDADDRPVLAGVTSWGYGCARNGTPGLYARVSSFQSWIAGNAELASFGGAALPGELDEIPHDSLDVSSRDHVTDRANGAIDSGQSIRWSFQAKPGTTFRVSATAMTAVDLYVGTSTEPTEVSHDCHHSSRGFGPCEGTLRPSESEIHLLLVARAGTDYNRHLTWVPGDDDSGSAENPSCGNVGKICDLGTPMSCDSVALYCRGSGRDGVCTGGFPECETLADCDSTHAACIFENGAQWGVCATAHALECICATSVGRSVYPEDC